MDKKQLLVGAAMLGMLAAGNLVSTSAFAEDASGGAAAPAAPTGTCHEKNGCKGQGGCNGYSGKKTATNGCAGQNTCKHHVMTGVTKAKCDEVKGKWKQDKKA